MSDDWKRLGAYVVQRRNELGYGSQVALEEASGVSYRTISRLETGHSIGKNNLRKLEQALLWDLGSVDAILAGGDPSPSKGQQPEGRRQESRSFIVGLTREELVNLADVYAEAFGEQAGEAFLLRAAEIRRDAAAGPDDQA